MEQLDGLYPEWDEFYLLVCEYCGIIIRPQALKKHLASKHRIVHLQQQPQQQPQQQQQQIPSQPQQNGPNKYQPNGTNSIPKPMDIDVTEATSTATTTTTTLTNTPTTLAKTNTTSNSNSNNNNSTTTNTYTMQQIPSRLWGGKHALDSLPKPAIQRRPCDWVKVRRATTPLLHAMRNWL